MTGASCGYLQQPVKGRKLESFDEKYSEVVLNFGYYNGGISGIPYYTFVVELYSRNINAIQQ